MYNTKHGEKRRFTDHLVTLQKDTYIELPLYTKNSVYSVQVTAFTTSSERMATKIVSFNSSTFDNAGLDGMSVWLYSVTNTIHYFRCCYLLPVKVNTPTGLFNMDK